MPRVLLATVLLLAAFAAGAEDARQTVCTITVNSADEREVFRRQLPPDRYRFVELVEHGRRDWLAKACREQVKCDVLVVSGHFAGTEFYSSRPDVDETLPVESMERAICTESCPGLFTQLKEVYLFGCDTLKAEPVRTATPEIVRGLVREGHAPADAERFAQALSRRQTEASRDLMRRLFAGVPVIYGFSAFAPLGRKAGPLLDRYLRAPDQDVGSGRVSRKLLALFGPSSMVVTDGQSPAEPDADWKGEVCRYYDGRTSDADKVAFLHRTLAGPMPEVRMAFDRAEKFFGALGERDSPALAAALEALASDAAARERYVGMTRATQDPALRLRMVALARNVGWLDARGEHDEQARAVRDLVAGGNVGFGEVELVCQLNARGGLDDALAGIAGLGARTLAQSAALACLGSAEARSRVVSSLASADEGEVQVAQSFLRHRPVTRAEELRALADAVARMRVAAAQVRALETVARHHVADPEVLRAFAALYVRTASAAVQDAIAEVFLRADPAALAGLDLPGVLRRYRVKSTGAAGLIDVLIGRLHPS